MKTRCTLAALMFFVCLCVLGQRSKIVPIQGQPQTTSKQVTPNQQETILQLQAENEAIQKQLEKMEKDIELYRGDVRTKVPELDNAQERWLNKLAIIMGLIGVILGIGAPYFINKDNRKRLENRFSEMRGDLKDLVKAATEQADAATNQANNAKESLILIQSQINTVREQLKSATEQGREATTQAVKAETVSNFIQTQVNNITEQVSSATVQAMIATEQTKQAKLAVEEIENLKQQVSKIQEKINADTAAAEKAAKEAKASQLFTEAFNEKDTSKAIELYNQAIDIKPDFSEAYNNRGLLKKKINDQEGALQDYNKAIELNPNNADTYNNRGILRKDLNDNEGALQDYNKAIELDPNDEGKYNNRADLYLKMNDFDKALADVNHSIDLGGGYVSFITKGEIYIAMEKYSDAIELFTQALLYNEKGKESFEYRAKCYRRLAETEPDEEKKAELIDKAEADEKKVASLKEGDKT